MAQLFISENIDLFLSGVAIAATLLLGVIVFFNNKKSITSRTFFLLSVVAALYGIFNYLTYQILFSSLRLWLIRLAIFSAIWYAFSLFHLFYVFPKEKIILSKFYRFALIPFVAVVSISTLTPLVFWQSSSRLFLDQIVVPERGPLIGLFGVSSIILVAGSFFILVKKTYQASGLQKKQLMLILIGTIITYSLIIVFNLVFPLVFDNPSFVAFVPLFTLPFIMCTAYAIMKYHLLNTKIISTEILTFILAIVTLFEVVIAKDPYTLIFRSGIFAMVLGFGVLLIKSVIREVEQREELEKLTKELEKKNVELDNLSHFKTQLLSLASHQIKAPLAAIKGFVSILSDGIYGPVSDKIKETLGKIKFSADDLINLINTLLDMRKVEEGKMDYKFEKTDLKKLAEEVVDQLAPLATNKKLEFTCICAAPGEVFVSADGQKLKQVIQNLVDNAIKYTPEGFVKVELKDQDGHYILSVTDSGLGVPADLLPHLFEEFIRDERVKQEIRGTGLGLYIARRIVEAHGGTISAASEGEGKGSTFSIRLPKL